MCCGSPLALRLERDRNPVSSGVSREKEQGAEDIARQIGERFHMKVDIE